MRIKIERPNLVSDALYNTIEQSGASAEYSRGLVVGVVSALMAVGNDDYEEVARFIINHLPLGVVADRLPAAFAQDLLDKMAERAAQLRDERINREAAAKFRN